MFKPLIRLPITSALIKQSSPCFLSTTTRTLKDSSRTNDSPSTDDASIATAATDSAAKEGSTASHKHKTQAQLDQELLEKMKSLSGDGGESGVEYENGVAVSMKRSVKDNMFRYI